MGVPAVGVVVATYGHAVVHQAHAVARVPEVFQLLLALGLGQRLEGVPAQLVEAGPEPVDGLGRALRQEEPVVGARRLRSRQEPRCWDKVGLFVVRSMRMERVP